MSKPFARTFGQDIMRGEHTVGSHPAVPGRKTSGLAESSAYTKDARLNPKEFRAGTFQGGAPDTIRDAAFYSNKRDLEAKLGREISVDEYRQLVPPAEEATASGTSIFDPVLTELAYRWFCPPKGNILDPFAGGSVRGIVASKLGFNYLGIDLRDEQIEANRIQADTICTETDPKPQWITGDSRNLTQLIGRYAPDFIFSCPPYADLERYSDDTADLSTLKYDEFRPVYSEIIRKSTELLKPDRFACFVVGDVRGRDKNGNYYGFPWHTIEAFQSAGLHLYNEAVLVTAIGSLPVRVQRQMRAAGKLGRTHQNVLFFIKGDARKAMEAINGSPLA